MKPAQYTTRTIVLHNDVWRELERLRKQHGSYNKVLRVVLAPFDAGKLTESMEMSRKLKEQGFKPKGYTLPAPHERRRAMALAVKPGRKAKQETKR